MGIKLYNKLSLELRKSEGSKYFKYKLKLFLLDYPFYTLHEFLSEEQQSAQQSLYSAAEIGITSGRLWYL
jgi:hypothetical protein